MRFVLTSSASHLSPPAAMGEQEALSDTERLLCAQVDESLRQTQAGGAEPSSTNCNALKSLREPLAPSEGTDYKPPGCRRVDLVGGGETQIPA